MKARQCVIFLAAALLLGGCKGASGPWGKMVRAVLGPSPSELARQLGDDDPDLRREAIEKLSRKKWGRREPYLKLYAAFTLDEAPTVRSAAVRALGRSGETKYAKDVALVLKDRESTVRWDAAVALDSLADDSVIEPLSRSAAADPATEVRVAAVAALRHYPRRDVLETLLARLDDPEFAVRFQAGESLEHLTGGEGGTDRAAWQRILVAKPDPFARPEKKRWWQRRRKKPPADKAKAESGRPWWDWMGVTRKKEAQGEPPATTRPAS